MDNSLDKVANLISSLPGIGPRQAKRLTYFLASKPDLINSLNNSLNSLKQEVRCCNSCFRLFPGKEEICNICNDQTKDVSKLMIVEKETSLEAILKSNTYNGLFFNLGGIIPFLDKNPTKYIRLKELELIINQRINSGLLTEVIFALSATPEGEQTINFLKKELETKFPTLIISTLGRGIANGTDMEYIDPETMKNALTSRK